MNAKTKRRLEYIKIQVQRNRLRQLDKRLHKRAIITNFRLIFARYPNNPTISKTHIRCFNIMKHNK